MKKNAWCCLLLASTFVCLQARDLTILQFLGMPALKSAEENKPVRIELAGDECIIIEKDTVLDGMGAKLVFAYIGKAQLVVNPHCTLTLKNITLANVQQGSIQLKQGASLGCDETVTVVPVPPASKYVEQGLTKRPPSEVTTAQRARRNGRIHLQHGKIQQEQLAEAVNSNAAVHETEQEVELQEVIGGVGMPRPARVRPTAVRPYSARYKPNPHDVRRRKYLQAKK